MRHRLPLLALIVIAASPSAAHAAAPAASGGAVFAPGEVLVKYDPDVGRSARARVQKSTGTGESRKLPGGTRRLQILDGESLGETVAELREDPRVEYAVANPIARASAFIPNDPGLGVAPGDWAKTQWNFFGPNGVGAPDAWEIANLAGAPGGAGVKVAVLDTGVAFTNRGGFRRAPDLEQRKFLRGYDFVDDDRSPADENGHGTHVTGTLAEATNNGQALTGLAYGVKVMPLRVLDKRGAGDAAAIARAMRFAAKAGVDVINMSLEFDASITASMIPEIVSAARYARRRGAVVVAAAGNQADTAVAYPARTDNVISVGATTENGCQADYSNTGLGLDIAAPGGGADAPNTDNPRDAAACKPGVRGRQIIQQTFFRSGAIRRFGFPDGYEGTSMAAPHVSATAALLIATKRLGPKPPPELVEQRLKLTARDLGPDGSDNRYGAGLLNAAAALGP